MAIYSAIKNRYSLLSLALVCGLVLLFCLAAFKNISYPLLWNDESETVMTAQQVMHYGYPKVHDGKNTIFIPDNPSWLGYKPSADANITMPWGTYYYAVIGTSLARFTDSLYLKTALVRLPFAFAGLLGVIMFAFACRPFFSNKVAFRLFLAAFIILELFSVTLLLHIREARYYPLVILLTACYFYITAMFHFHNGYSKNKYITLLTLILVLAFNVNSILFVSIFATTALYLCYQHFKSRTQKSETTSVYSLKETLLLATPLLLTTVLILPQLIFFETFKTSRLANIYYHNSFTVFIQHLRAIVAILFSFELLAAMFIIKAIKWGCSLFIKRNNLPSSNNLIRIKDMSFFAALFFVVYMLVTARMPFLFTRYFIVLQPLLALILLADIVIILQYLKAFSFQKVWTQYSALLLTGICITNIALCNNHIVDYAYQLLHPYHGPLDYFIPDIKQRFAQTEKLVVATNYEELSYEYYLNCKVMLGYQNHFRLTEDTTWKQEMPDVIILRPGWPQDNMPYQYYLQHGHYQKITFPVQNSQVNNVPDMYAYLKHQFKTQIAEKDEDRACMYVKH